ncbi:MAG: adenylosuccinate synthetase [Kouleothrix sp.]
MRRPGTVVFEAAQGVLLGEWYAGIRTAWSTTTLANADRLLAEAGYDGGLTRVSITRAYATRHGAGPLPSEDAALLRRCRPRPASPAASSRAFRVGWLGLVLLRHALAVVGRLDTGADFMPGSAGRGC